MQNLFYPLEQLYKYLYLATYDIIGNYGIALILLSLFIYIVLFPFNQRAQQIQNEERDVQAIISPQIAEIKKQYHGKEQYEKIQRLYHRYAYHPIYAIRSAAGIVFQIPFFVAARSMLYSLQEIKGVQWGVIQNLGEPDQLLAGINLLPFVMTFVTILYAFVMPKLTKKEITQTIIIGIIFLIILYPAPSALLIFWTWNLLWSLLHSLLFNRLNWFNDYFETLGGFISENQLAFHIIFALSLSVGLLVPLEVYIKNAEQLWFGVKDVLKYLFTDTFKYFGVLFLVYLFCWYKKIRCVYLSVLLGLLFAVFLQSYIISIDYGLFDGHEIKWDEYTWKGIINTFIWLFCIVETLIVFRRFNYDGKNIKKFVKPIAFGIVVIQCIVLSFSFIKNPLPENAFRPQKSMNILTTKDMFTISSKDNIIVFLLDAFDAKIFEEIMEKEPEIINQLNGFTFYPDTTSVYGYTDYSLPQILTGKIYYNDRPYVEYFEEAWKDNIYYKKLLENNYDIGIYTAGNLVSKSAPILNLISEKVLLNDDSMQSLKNLVKFRMAPHYVKKRFYEYNPNAWMNLLANKNTEVYQEDDRKFFDNQKKGLSYRDDKNCFRFYHLVGAHYPFILDRNMAPISKNKNGSQYEQSVGAMKIVLEFIKQMKEKNVFDSSTFVIMADHGEHNKIGSRPLLCIKQPDNKKKMKISNASVSFAQFMPMLFAEVSVDESQKNSFEIKRIFYFMDENKGFIKYQIVGNAKSLNSWKKDELALDGRTLNNVYKLGDSIDFTMQGESSRYKGKGWSKREESYGSWTLGSDSDLLFKIEGYQKQDLKVDFVAISYLANLPFRKVKVFANDNFITEILFKNEKSLYSFSIPSTVIDKNVLKLHFTIDHSGISVNYEDGRDLGIFMKRLKIDAVQ